MSKGIIWARVSSREQRDGYSIDAQLRVTREKAQKEGWTIVREFVVAESAKRGADREAFHQMVKWVRANARREKINFVLAHKLDRICRNMRDAVKMQELEDACGVRLAFVDNQFGPGAAGALSFNVMAAVAQYYSDNLRHEVLKGIEEKARQGWGPGQAAYGYVHVKGNKDEPVQPHPTNAAAVQRIFELYGTGRYTFRQIGDILAEEGHVRRPSYPRFDRSALSYILNNRFYIGLIKFRGETLPGRHRPLIDVSVFETCQNILRGKNRRTNKVNHYLGGLFTCEYCGYGVGGERIRRRMENGTVYQYIYYRCNNPEPGEGHPVLRWRENQLEAAIERDLMRLRIPEDECRDWFRNRMVEACHDKTRLSQERLRKVRKRLTELEQMQQRLLDGYLNGAIEKTVFSAKKNEIQIETEQMQKRLEDDSNNDDGLGEYAVALFDFAQNAAETWRVSEKSVRRELLVAILQKRSLTDVSLLTTKRKPFDVLVEKPVSEESLVYRT